MLEKREIKEKFVWIGTPQAKNFKFHYLEYKSTKANALTCLLLSPASRGVDLWRTFLTNAEPEYNYVAVGLPSFEQNDDIPNDFFTVKDLTEFYKSFIEELQLDNLIIVSVSLTATVATELTYHCPEKINTVIFMGGGEFFHPIIRKTMRIFLYLMVRVKVLRILFYNIAKLFIGILRRFDQEKLRDSFRYIYAATLYKIPDKKSGVRAILINGELDHIVWKETYTKYKKNYPNHKYLVFTYNHQMDDGNIELAINEMMPKLYDLVEKWNM